MIFRQITHDDLGCASYLVGDEKAGTAAVVDPRFDIEEYLELARYVGVSIDAILETHNHADHLSGHGRLAVATGAPVYIHRDAKPDYEHTPIDDGFELELGSVIVRALHTPGHRPEHTAFALIDRDRADEPWAVLSGDSLFVNDIARPDLAVEEREGAQGIYHSLHDKLLTLPATCEVWPGHLGGSMCGGPGMDMKVSSTIGYELHNNELLKIDDEAEFVRQSVEGLGPQPPNFEAIVALNTGPLVTDDLQINPLAPRQLLQHQRDGALVVDVRTDQQFDEGHVEGAISIPLMRAGFGSKLAWVADRDLAIAFVGRDDDDGRRAARLAVAVGIFRFAGFLSGGMTGWRQEGREVVTIERLPIEELPDREDVQILDVRERSEWKSGHIPGATFTPWHDITSIPDGLDPAAPIAAVCGSGQRAAVAASLLAKHGADQPIHVVGGGVPAWAEMGNPIEVA